MILDANQLESGAVLFADICIVGAGAAGIALALQFLESRHSVLLLEAGGEGEEADTQALYSGHVTDETLHSPPETYRQRRLGGSTTIWGGRCVPLDPIDFERRAWLPGSGWPIGLADLMPYYPEANRICEAGHFAYTAEDAFPLGMRAIISGFKGRHFTDNTLERFSCPTDFGRRYRVRLAASRNLRVLLHANVTNIRCRPDGATVAGLDVSTLTGRRFSVSADQVVLAAGGLEVPRMLLASRDHHPNGLGNNYDQVGRNYMCHLAGTVGELRVRPDNAVWHSYEVADEGVYCRRRFALTEAAQRRLGLGNFVARLHHPHIPDPSHLTGALSALFLARPLISYEYRKRLHGAGKVSAATWLRHLRNVILDPFGATGFSHHLLRDRIWPERKFPSVVVRPKANLFSLDFHSEQQPNNTSRVKLTADRDALGMQRILVDWRHSAGDLWTVKRAVAALADDIEASGCGKLHYDADAVEMCALREGAYGGHHIGTTRMSATPSDGVVDSNCRVHGIANLYIAGSSTFPTSGQANPTLTIVAMALRLADHLQKRASQQVWKTCDAHVA